MSQWMSRIGRRLLLLALLSLVGGLFGATLVRFAPGYGMDERELDPRLSEATRQAIRNEHRLHSGLFSYYGSWLVRAAHGDLGRSEWLDRPIAGLLAERFPLTLRSVLLGVLTAWSAAIVLALASLGARGWAVEIAGTISSGFLIALPAAVVALAAMYLRAPVFLAIAAVTFPKVFQYLRNLLIHAYEQPCVLAARARGIGQVRLLLRHVLRLAGPPIVALLGVSISMAFGAAIPMEALCDSPGIGQLAWLAALNRDLPLIMNLTLVVTVITVAANSAADLLHQEAQ